MQLQKVFIILSVVCFEMHLGSSWSLVPKPQQEHTLTSRNKQESLRSRPLHCGRNISSGRATIRSPGFGMYSSRANCTWTFHIPRGKLLKMKMTDLNLYYYVNNTKTCDDSYRLLIDGEPVDCHQLILRSNWTCADFLSSPACQPAQKIRQCETRKFQQSVKIEYHAAESKVAGSSYHFRMAWFSIKYVYEKCKKPKAVIAATTSAVLSAAVTGRETRATIIPNDREAVNSSIHPAESDIITETSDHSGFPDIATGINAVTSDCTTVMLPHQTKGTAELISAVDATMPSSNTTNEDTSITSNSVIIYVPVGAGSVALIAAMLELIRRYRYSIKRRTAAPALEDLPSPRNDVLQNTTYFYTISEGVERHNYEMIAPRRYRQEKEPQTLTRSRPVYENVTLPRPIRHDYDDVAIDTSTL